MGAIIGAALTRVAAERGRKRALVYNGIVNGEGEIALTFVEIMIAVVAAIVSLTAKSLESPMTLVIGRFLFGICMGLTTGLVPM